MKPLHDVSPEVVRRPSFTMKHLHKIWYILNVLNHNVIVSVGTGRYGRQTITIRDAVYGGAPLYPWDFAWRVPAGTRNRWDVLMDTLPWTSRITIKWSKPRG